MKTLLKVFVDLLVFVIWWLGFGPFFILWEDRGGGEGSNRSVPENRIIGFALIAAWWLIATATMLINAAAISFVFLGPIP